MSELSPEVKQRRAADREKKAAERKERRLKSKYRSMAEAHKAQKHVRSVQMNIEWYRSRTWGYCPRMHAWATYIDGTVERRDYSGVTGCGYDKESTIIANLFNDVLAYKLYQDRPRESKPYGVCYYEMFEHELGYYDGGIGVASYYDIAKYIGGELVRVASGKAFDCYKYIDHSEGETDNNSQYTHVLQETMS